MGLLERIDTLYISNYAQVEGGLTSIGFIGDYKAPIYWAINKWSEWCAGNILINRIISSKVGTEG